MTKVFEKGREFDEIFDEIDKIAKKNYASNYGKGKLIERQCFQFDQR